MLQVSKQQVKPIRRCKYWMSRWSTIWQEQETRQKKWEETKWNNKPMVDCIFWDDDDDDDEGTVTNTTHCLSQGQYLINIERGAEPSGSSFFFYFFFGLRARYRRDIEMISRKRLTSGPLRSVSRGVLHDVYSYTICETHYKRSHKLKGCCLTTGNFIYINILFWIFFYLLNYSYLIKL